MKDSQIGRWYYRHRTLIIALCILVMGYYFMYLALGQDILSHNPYDSYSRQAVSWWEGRADFQGDYRWLELARYHNKYYLGFGPVPSAIYFFLVPFYGEETPNNLVVTICALLCFVVAYSFCKRREMTDLQALFWSIFLVMGGNLVAISVSGGVWFQAQVLSFLLTLLSLYFITTDGACRWHLGLFFWALAVGCRPLQVLYLPLYLYLLFDNLAQSGEITYRRDLLKLLPYAYLPVIVFALYGWYNWIRFGSTLEFGHNYTAEALSAPYGQFSFHYVKENLAYIFRLPALVAGSSSRITLPRYDGFLFFLANPIIIPFFTRLCGKVTKKSLSFLDIAIPALILVHIAFFLCHKTMGGWQFGVRYFVNFLPFVFFYICSREPKFRSYEILLMAFGVIFNIYGAAWLHLNWH